MSSFFEKYGVDAQYERVGEATNCPNCGAPIQGDSCPYCGTVFVDFATIKLDEPFFAKIEKDGKIIITKLVLNSLSVHTETECLYADNTRIISPITTMTAEFEVIK